jgi:hypothetical protein
VAADALSMIGHVMQIHTVTELKPVWVQEILNAYVIHKKAQDLLAQLALASLNEQGFSLHQGIIRKGDQIWISNNSALQTKLISALHDSVVGRHSGGEATYQGSRDCSSGKGSSQ